ncbi:MAG: hypothetical protein KF819_29750 [Labilithrix sp.]|nr:hypothetical protein [Labilithrix sp.]
MRLVSDTRGGIGVAGLFMTAFLAGAVFYSASIAHTAGAREELQGRADGAAFSEAVASAKGMNMIAAMNRIMVTLAAVELPIRAMKPSYEKVAKTPCLDPCSCAIAADAKRASAELEALSKDVEAKAGDALLGVSEAQAAISDAAPKLGRDAASSAASPGGPTPNGAKASIYSPSLSKDGCKSGLPVQEDSFKSICTRAKKYTAERANALSKDKLQTMNGACKSGANAMTDATPGFARADDLFCTEAKSPPCGGSGPHPRKMANGAANGNDALQFWSKVSGTPVGEASHAIDPLTNREPARGGAATGMAQSEIYFDCTGSFESCNKNDQATYDPKWAARLRRIHAPTQSFAGDAEVKNEIANGARWSSRRSELLRSRGSSPRTAAGAILMSSQEGPLQ